jgi:hypothetical protein
MDYQTYEWSPSADGALAALDEGYGAWLRGIRELGSEGLEQPIGLGEGPWAEHPYAELVLHINREVLHHGAEILLLRDLYRNRS